MQGSEVGNFYIVKFGLFDDSLKPENIILQSKSQQQFVNDGDDIEIQITRPPKQLDESMPNLNANDSRTLDPKKSPNLSHRENSVIEQSQNKSYMGSALSSHISKRSTLEKEKSKLENLKDEAKTRLAGLPNFQLFFWSKQKFSE